LGLAPAAALDAVVTRKGRNNAKRAGEHDRMAWGLPELQRTPPRGRHPFVYLAGCFLFFAFVAFIARLGMVWVVAAAAIAVLLAIGAIASTLRGH